MKNRNASVTWNKEAMERLQKVPFFLRKKVKSVVEDFTAENGIGTITSDHLEDARRKFFARVSRNEAGKEMGRAEENPCEENRLYELTMCRGSKLGCPFSLEDSEDLEKSLREALDESSYIGNLEKSVEGLLLPHHRFKISASACPNSCSQPQIKDIGIQALSFPALSQNECLQCGRCVESCAEAALVLNDTGPLIDREKCIGCGVCHQLCPSGTIAKGKKGYRVLLGGRLGRHPKLGAPLDGLFSVERIRELLRTCLEEMEKRSSHGKRLGEIMETDEDFRDRVIFQGDI